MGEFGRVKRVTDPLDDKVRARIIPDYLSSGSERCSHADNDAVSPILSDLVFGFLVDNAGTGDSPGDDSDSDRDPVGYDSVVAIEDLIKPIVLKNTNADSYRNRLYADVIKAVEVFSCVKSNAPVLRRNVMAFLRNLGYNTAISKTKWESSGGLAAGNYEFIDVLRSESLNRFTRYIIDLDFAREFEIARPTSNYERAVRLMPRVFVGKSEELKQILKVMSDAAKRSLKSRGLHLPPWRKHRYMQNKWVGPYKRTTNIFPVAAPVFPKPPPLNVTVKCRSVGFEVAAVNGRLLFPATTRTR
ncbi:hypothetical protein ACH5RR_010383 [Cinchona calisaya]|uniref:Uncharacterized protein n=1 Tax=Cinchona calisaya TaxID=153742 RepID=A0ABD3AIS9_9GENT